MQLDRRLPRAKHFKTRRKKFNQKAKQMHWLLGRRSTQSIGTPPVQSSIQSNMDLWNSAMGNSFQVQQQNPPSFLIQNSPIHSERTFVHGKPQDP
jgi:hypothetical protein